LIIDEQFRKCVAFLVLDGIDPVSKQPKRSPIGTGFFVGVPVGDVGTDAFLVTARHVIEGARPFGRLFVRLNKKGQPGFTDFASSPDDWLVHPTTDVAVLPVNTIPQDAYEWLWLPQEMLAGDDYLSGPENGVFEGDDIFFVGLFTPQAGTEHSHPIVRFGNVSLTPREKVSIKLSPDPAATRVPVDAYLVEARSWGGQSGSPAFMFYAPDRRPGTLTVGAPRFALLGVTHGHFDIEQKVKLIGARGGEAAVDLNAGIAVVIPAQKVIDQLMHKDLVARRAAILKQIQDAAPVATPDRASEKP
jgi:hypothetical protein